MLRNLRCEDEDRKPAEQNYRKLCPIAKNQLHERQSNKENKAHVQLKSSSPIHRRKLEIHTIPIREIFTTYSRIHTICLTKIHTLFLAFHLYELAIANTALKNVPQNYRTLCCMFIAIKYEEIYPPALRELAKYLKVSYNLDEYRHNERLILKSIGVNLNVATLDRMLEVHFEEGKYTKIEEMTSFYLLELAFASGKIYKVFNQSDICQAITKLVKREATTEERQSSQSSAVNQIMRLIIQARGNLKGLERNIFGKYQSEKYLGVSRLPICLQMK